MKGEVMATERMPRAFGLFEDDDKQCNGTYNAPEQDRQSTSDDTAEPLGSSAVVTLGREIFRKVGLSMTCHECRVGWSGQINSTCWLCEKQGQPGPPAVGIPGR